MTCTYVSKANYIWQPQDFINLSAQFPGDFNIGFYDCSIDNISKEELFKTIAVEPPDIALIALSSIVYGPDMDFLKDFRNRFKDTKILILGDIFLEKVFWEKGMEHADGLILNSIDINLAEYIETGRNVSENLILKGSIPTEEKAYSAKSKKVSIGVPRHELFINKKYRFPFVRSFLYSTVSTQFGCLYQCNYCSQCKIPVSYRDYGEVLEEIRKVHSLGVRDIFFGDPNFGFPKENALPLLEGMIKNNFSMRWVCYINPALVDGEILRLMKKSGCHTVIIGVEDEDIDMLRELYKRTLSRQRLQEFCSECNRLGINVCGDFIIGLNSDEKAVERMVDFAKMLKLDYASFNIFSVLFGSKVRENLIKEGKIDPYIVGFDTSGTYGQNERLVRLRNMAVKKFYLRPSYLLRRISRISSLPELIIQFEEMVTMFKNHILKRKADSD
ncbi:MAG: radical SAM protein [Nitrospirae bacterium]|nr:radical SAM protein [Nitrospirota bacterium]